MIFPASPVAVMSVPTSPTFIAPLPIVSGLPSLSSNSKFTDTPPTESDSVFVAVSVSAGTVTSSVSFPSGPLSSFGMTRVSVCAGCVVVTEYV